MPLVLLLASWAVAVEEVKIAELDPKTPGQVVLFYRKGEAASDAAAAALADAQTLVAERAGERATGVVFKQCDAAQKENKVGMEARGLSSSLPMLFVAVEGQGTGSPVARCCPAACAMPPPARPDAVRRPCRSLYAQHDGRRDSRVRWREAGGDDRGRRVPLQRGAARRRVPRPGQVPRILVLALPAHEVGL